MRHSTARSVAHDNSRELHDLWLRVMRGPWPSIAVIPTAPDISAVSVTAPITELARFFEMGSFKVFDARGVALTGGSDVAREIRRTVADGSRVVVAVDDPTQNSGAVPVVMCADASLLVVRYGSSRLHTVRGVIELVGRERILGCLTLHDGARQRPIS